MNDYADSFQHFLSGFDQVIQSANPLKLLNYLINPEFLQLFSFESLMKLHHLLEPHLQSPRAQSLRETPLVQKFQDEIVFRHLIRIPRDFSNLRQLLESQFPEEPLTQALDGLTRAVRANADWIQQEVAFLGELEQIRGQGSRFEEIIVKILNAFSPEMGQNRASTHIAFVRRGEVGEVAETSPTLADKYLRPAILRKIATVGRPAGNAIFPDANIGSEFERAAYSIQFELKGEGLLEEFIEYRFVDALNYWDKFYSEGRSAGLAFAFLAFAYHNPLYHLLSPYLICFGAYEDGIIKHVEAIREKVTAAQERGMRILILPESDVPQAQDCLQACQIVPYRVGTLREVLDSITEDTASLAKRLRELYPTQTDISIVPSPSEKSIQPLEGENRLVTALFAELSGVTQMSPSMTTEAILEKVNQCRQVVTDAVSRYEGNLHGFTGDRASAFFGAPLAHEQAPERAIRAALDMQKLVAELGLNLSVGINTGMVYFGPIGAPEHQEISAYGSDINLAKRLQESANPGQILVGEGTYRLTRRAFEFQSQPPLTLKDIEKPVSVYQALKALPKPEKVRGIEGLKAPMIGRDE